METPPVPLYRMWAEPETGRTWRVELEVEFERCVDGELTAPNYGIAFTYPETGERRAGTLYRSLGRASDDEIGLAFRTGTPEG